MSADFQARGLHRLLGFIVFLLSFVAVMFIGAALFALEMPLVAALVMFVGVSLASFLGLLTTHRLCRKELEEHKRNQLGAFVMPTERHQS